jgi:hypothetical protein
VDVYHTLYPLDTPPADRKVLGYSTACYKVTSSVDGMLYCLRQIKGVS